MKRKRQRQVSILLIPDANSEPYSFKIKLGVVRLLIAVAVLLVAHILFGGYAYWRWSRIAKENSKLLADNQRLLKDNQRIYLLASQFEEIVNQHEKVLKALGVDGFRSNTASVKSLDLSGFRPQDVPRPSAESPTAVKPNIKRIVGSSSFIAHKKTRLHDYTPNLPTFLPVEGYLTADFEPHGWLIGRRHPGIDIAARRGKVIRAAGGGMIVFAGWTARYGNMVIINHGNNIFSYYAHNKKLLVQDKAYVKKGDPIALLGNTGSSSTGPHLHFEIWRDGQPVNPREYLLAFQTESN